MAMNSLFPHLALTPAHQTPPVHQFPLSPPLSTQKQCMLNFLWINYFYSESPENVIYGNKIVRVPYPPVCDML